MTVFNQLPTRYSEGTASVAANATTVTGTGTNWTVLQPGDLFGVHKGLAIPIAAISADGLTLTLAYPWSGAAQTNAAYCVQLVSRSVGVQEATRQLLLMLANGNLDAFAALDALGDQLPIFTGPGVLSLIDKSMLISGANYDTQVNTLADRATYDGSQAGYRVLVSDVGNGRSAIYSKKSNTSGDWSNPAYVTGATGAGGPYTEITIGTVTTLPYGSSATINVVPVDADTIRLDFGIPAGQNGTGTGDVVGPSSSVDNELALFNGTTGKQIKRGPLLSTLGSGQNEAILALEIADLKGSRLGMKGGVADAFDDETGVDVKTNATYDAANDWYVPTVSAYADQTVTHTAATTSGNTVTASSTAGSGYEGWRAFDKVEANASTNIGSWASGNTTTGWLQYQFSAAKTITSYSIKSPTPTARMPSTWTLLGSNTGAFAGEQVVLDTRSSQTGWLAKETRRFSVANPGSYLYYRINVTANNGDTLLGIDEVTFDTGGTPNNMTLISIAYPLASVPTNARLTVQTVEFEAATANTDFVAEFSRDGGTTWTAGNLVLSPYLVVGAYKMYEAASFSVSSQPSGSSMKWRLRTLTNKNIAMSGVVSQGN